MTELQEFNEQASLARTERAHARKHEPKNSSELLTVEDISDGAIGGLPHLLQVEFLHPRFIRCDGRALDADPDPLHIDTTTQITSQE